MYLDKRTIRDIVSDQSENYWETIYNLKEKTCLELLIEKISKFLKKSKI